ncbi:hypothetical protein D3C75_344300 [compost metagenome]
MQCILTLIQELDKLAGAAFIKVFVLASAAFVTQGDPQTRVQEGNLLYPLRKRIVAQGYTVCEDANIRLEGNLRTGLVRIA